MKIFSGMLMEEDELCGEDILSWLGTMVSGLGMDVFIPSSVNLRANAFESVMRRNGQIFFIITCCDDRHNNK